MDQHRLHRCIRSLDRWDMDTDADLAEHDEMPRRYHLATFPECEDGRYN